MKLLALGLVDGLVAIPGVLAAGPVPVSRSGLAGIAGFDVYEPYCAHGCFRAFSPFVLSCSKLVSPGGHQTPDSMAHELALCRASSIPYLSSIAWCIQLYCPQSTSASVVENFWETEITGDVNVMPEWSYGETLARITEPPTQVVVPGTGLDADGNMVLNMTILTTYRHWNETQRTLRWFFRETVLESYFGLALCLIPLGLPIFVTWLGYIPSLNTVLKHIQPWLLPSVIGTYHARPLPYLLGNAPTIGQTVYIAVLVILNILFLATGYETLWPTYPNQWYANRSQEILALLVWRTGALAFCQMPLLFLLSTRNNLLMYLTSWSQSTYMLLHRWVARVFLSQVLLHSIISWVLYIDDGAYAETLVLGWWIWGCVSTVAAVLIILASALIFRQRAYEMFLVTHIILAVVCVVGAWYHIYLLYDNTFGFESWLYATIAVWFFDRVARVASVMKSGVRRSRVVEVGPQILRIDIPNVGWAADVGPSESIFVYFPTLNWLRPWENHPFSVIHTPMLSMFNRGNMVSRKGGARGPDVEASNLTMWERSHRVQGESQHGEKMLSPTMIAAASTTKVAQQELYSSEGYSSSGLTLFIRKEAGLTGYLKPRNGLFTFLEGPYRTNGTKPVLRSDRLLLVGGGIGITGLASFVGRHQNLKLFYSVKARDKSLISSEGEGLGPLLEQIGEKEIKVGVGLNIQGLLREEAEMGWASLGIVVCGPASMCDDVRAVVAGLGKELLGKTCFELEVNMF